MGNSWLLDPILGDIRIWNVETKRQAAAHKCKEGAGTYSLAFSPDGQTLVAGCGDGTVQTWGEGGKKKGDVFAGHTKEVYSLAFSPDGKVLASGSHDGKVILWKTDTWKPIREVKTGLLYVFCVAFSPDGKVLAAGGNVNRVPSAPTAKAGCVEFYSMDSLEKINTLRPHVLPVLSVGFDSDGIILATCGGDDFDDKMRSAKIWKTKEVIAPAKKHEERGKK